MKRSATLALLVCALVGRAAAQDGMGAMSKFFAEHPLLALHHHVSGAPVSGARGGSTVGVTTGASAYPGATAGATATAGSGAMPSTPMTVPAQCASVADGLASSGSFTALLAAAQASGLAGALSDKSLQATVFAPNDAAFTKFFTAMKITGPQLAANPQMLQAILKYHIVPGSPLLSTDLKDEQQLDTLLTADLQAAAQNDPLAYWHQTSDKEDGTLTIQIKDVYGWHPVSYSERIAVVGSLTKANITKADVNAGCPAVIHVIDNVLLPKLASNDSSAQHPMGSMWGSLVKLYGGSS